MAGAAASGFISRAFESMLKECSGKKYPALHKSIQTYLDGTKEVDQHSAFSETNQAASLTAYGSSSKTDAGIAKNEIEANHSRAHTGEGVERVGRPVSTSGTITAVLAHAGHTLEGAEVKLVLNPLRLAIETKNLKVLEPALDVFINSSHMSI
ncbi:hypothetical protein PVL29_018491 [Vitis rotundifolia]|uniref:Uncharacterized protein n=1 Tax=Vitis rotundifolia TaxID=103349 RepID=A0AA38Z5G6_VITRO|nr:hypothetical protein PVL29_018491 [Vitis rotundifolia]